MTEMQDTSRETTVGFISVIVAIGVSGMFQPDLEPVVGYVGSVAGDIVISAVIVFVVCLFGKLSRPKALAISVLLAPTLVTFEQIRRHLLESTSNSFFSVLLATASAFAVGFVVALLVKCITGVDSGAAGDSTSVDTRMDA